MVMLQSFVETIDTGGLQSSRVEDDSVPRVPLHESGNPFWAVLDSSELPAIARALVLGQRQMALQLLFAIAKSLGPAGT
jgi:hypothetical protein